MALKNLKTKGEWEVSNIMNALTNENKFNFTFKLVELFKKLVNKKNPSLCLALSFF